MRDEPMVRLELPRNYVGQLLDGLEVLIEQWEETGRAMSGEGADTTDRVMRECSSDSEAFSIAEFYRKIYRRVVEQMK
jgi:hypothetical protein